MNIQTFIKDVGFGLGLNRAKFEDDGTLVFEGDATVYDDLLTSFAGLRLNSVVGKVAYDYNENGVTFKSGVSITTANDIVNLNFQYPHKAKTNGLLNLHIHWEQDDTYANKAIQWSVKYRIHSNNSAKVTTWTTVVVEATDANNAFDYVSGTLNQITPLVDIDMTGASISSVIQIKLARTDSATGDILGTFCDSHFQIDTLGSRQEYVK